MPDDLASSSVLISSGITLIAAFLGLRQWYERRARQWDLSDHDRQYFFRQDLRRGTGVAVMLLVAAGLYFGSRIPPRVGGRVNLAFLQVWLAIIGLTLFMLGLALLDWISTRLYARRHHRSLAEERRRILRATIRPKDDSIDSETEGGSD